EEEMSDRLENTHQPRDLAIPADLMPRKVEVKKPKVLLTVKNVPWIDILPALKGGDSHFTEASQCAPTCTQDLQLLHGLTPPVRRPKHCGRRLCHGRGLIHIQDIPTHAR